MTELKTLNKIEFVGDGLVDRGFSPLVVRCADLREEAIKWIRFGREDPARFFLQLNRYNTQLFSALYLMEITRVEGIEIKAAFRMIEYFIKHFFNITEEDLVW